MTEWNNGMQYFFYTPCIREWPFDSFWEQKDYNGSKDFSTSFSLYKHRSRHLTLASKRGQEDLEGLDLFC